MRSGGVFVYADQCKGSSSEIYQKHIDSWLKEAFNLASTNENWKTWMDQRDYHSIEKDQLF